ncbi:hypothetical protein [Azospirillum griseum]|uniref:hypothetical protein n=1 Tax=Azospirillum griseum TaxID=2496639 RepID=UPI001AECABD2|nr:hypothetical protein [Azospirillum griseum]
MIRTPAIRPTALIVSAALMAGPLALATPTAAQPADAPCSPTVSAALGAWDSGMAAAEIFGDKALALAREKGRDYLLPLLGIDPKAVPPANAPGGSAGNTDDVARAIEASRNDPKRRAELCAVITRSVNEARDGAEAKLDALKRAIDGWRTPAPATPAPAAPPTPAPAPAGPGGLIKT